MSVWLRAPVLRLVVFFVTGILISGVSDFSTHWIWVLISLIVFSALSMRRLSYYRRYLSGLFLGVSGLLLSILVVQVHQSLLEQERSFLTEEEHCIVEGKLLSTPKQGQRTTQFQLEVNRVYLAGQLQVGSAKVIIYLQRDSLSQHNSLQAGQRIVMQTQFRRLTPPLNPGEFNYREFMERRGVFYSAYCDANQFRVVDHNPKGVRAYFESVRQRMAARLESTLSGAQKDVVVALALGDKSGLDRSTASSFKAAGTMHVLAVSGLHVGLIFVLLIRVLSPLPGTSGWKLLRFAILLIGLWSYATLTGLSPSVLRAATMFSFLALGEISGKKTNSYNLLACAALVMLCVNPYLIYELGFQLSYMAVFGILFIQPILEGLWKPRWRMVNWIWQLGTVSLAAQLATFPITVYHFHSFPNYFLLANLAVVPLATIVLYNAIAYFVLQFIPGLSEILGWCLSKSSGLLIDFVWWIEQLPASQSQWLYLSPLQAVLAVVIVWTFSSWLASRRSAWLSISLLSLLISFAESIMLLQVRQSQQHVVIHHIERQSAMSVAAGKSGATYSWSEKNNGRLEQLQEAFAIDKGVRHPSIYNIRRNFDVALEINGLKIQRMSGDSMINRVPAGADVIWLANNPTVNWTLWEKELKNPEIVMDGSCSRYWVREQLKLAQDAGFYPHITRKEGAWVFSSAEAAASQRVQHISPNDSIQ